MDQEAKKILGILTALVMAGLIYYGSYLPYEKSASLINTMTAIQGNGQGREITLQQFEDSFQNTLNIPSPIGQYEVVRQMDSTIQNTLANATSVPEAAAQEITNFALKYTQPIIDSGTGANFVQNFLVMGSIYRSLGENYHNVSYLDKALQYYEEGLKYSPRRPQFLYGELAVYLSEGDSKDALGVARQILTYWPADANTQQIVKQLEAASPSTPTKK